MKLLFFSLFVIGSLAFCACQSGTTTVNTAVQAAQDSIAINNTIHEFFRWYAPLNDKRQGASDLVIKQENDYLALNPEGLNKFIANGLGSGLLSRKWAESERLFYKECAKSWVKQSFDELPEGFDFDKMYCAQDGDFEEFTTAPVSVMVTGGQAKATMKFKAGSGNGENRYYELDKEDGKWRISKIECALSMSEVEPSQAQ